MVCDTGLYRERGGDGRPVPCQGGGGGGRGICAPGGTDDEGARGMGSGEDKAVSRLCVYRDGQARGSVYEAERGQGDDEAAKDRGGDHAAIPGRGGIPEVA